MADDLRVAKYNEMKSDPHGFLDIYFNLTPNSEQSKVIEKMAAFAQATGCSPQLEAAIDAFNQQKELPDFVLQAASADVRKRVDA